MHRPNAQADILLQLVIGRLGTSMGMLTLHGPNGDPPRVLTAVNMPQSVASAMAAVVDEELAVPRAKNSHWRLPSVVPSTRQSITRLTFPCRAAPSCVLALTACSTGADASFRDDNLCHELQAWIEPFLAMFWQSEQEQAIRHGLARAIDRFDFGIILLDADGLPVFVSARAERLLDVGDGIRRAGHAIAATDFDDAVRLQAAIRSDSGSGNSFHVMLLHRVRHRPLIAVVASLGNQQDIWGKTAIALYILDPDQDSQAMVAALCRVHGLTATESALAMHLVSGATIEDAAGRMRIQTQTARAYLKQVFAKTGTHRQAELVRTILSGIIHIH
ncbi:helix-turn-helix transcriptional regulator [Sphingobium sp. EM0848]|uniref:helix-turn-helix transcriptional regulator n=1 Tax=Sphingobium sp. EM0848 TaxID=2743473 RepID=UPI001C3FE705|nr:helix-turn-helix transcriptional regulator [Sphingobium sp. EM0848]